MSIAMNPVHHERTKHVKVHCHFVRDKINSGAIAPTYVPSKLQLADILTKGLPIAQHQLILSKPEVQALPHSQFEGESRKKGPNL